MLTLLLEAQHFPHASRLSLIEMISGNNVSVAKVDFATSQTEIRIECDDEIPF